MSGATYFDKNGIEIKWKNMGQNDGKYGVMVAVTDDLTGVRSVQYIEDLEVLKELIEVLVRLRDS